MSRRRGRGYSFVMKIVVGLLLFAVVVAAALWSWMAGVGTGKPPQSEITELLETKNLALAELENNRLSEAFEPLRKVANAAPDDRFGWQNLAVAGLLASEKIDRRRKPEEFEAADRAAADGLAGLNRVYAGESVTYYLEGIRLELCIT